jgi:DNA-binding PadR family transcriptional regulator
VLELAILGLLKEQDLHGYELKKRLAETLGVVSGVSFGSLYPALARLERAGAVHTVESVGAGRSKKVYGITSRGDELFDELLVADSVAGDDSRMFHLRVAFARYLPSEARIGMLERRRAHLLDVLTRSGRNRSGRRIDGYVRSLMEHDRESTEHDLSWIDRLLESERGQTPDPVATPSAIPARPAPLAAAAPTLSGLWRSRGGIKPIFGPKAQSNQEESPQ